MMADTTAFDFSGILQQLLARMASAGQQVFPNNQYQPMRGGLNWDQLSNMNAMTRAQMPRQAVIDAIMQHYGLGQSGLPNARTLADQWSMWDNPLTDEINPTVSVGGRYKY